MGVILQGILGGFSGKVGPVVGGKWKVIDYMRSYVIPANPNTVSQQAVRTKFAALVARARDILTTILQPYWDPFQTNMSGFNAWIAENYSETNATGILDATVIMAKGTLTKQMIDTAVYGGTEFDVTWVENENGNALPTDSIMCICYNLVAKQFFFAAAPVARSVETITVPAPEGGAGADNILWIFAFRGSGPSFIVSDSDGVVGTDA
jgi:hypothetical protein